MGYTDDLEEVAAAMRAAGQVAVDHHYGLWYDRRREDHERIRRVSADVWPPFYEMPFARTGQGAAWDGLTLYDLTKFNPWYWGRLKEFAEICDQRRAGAVSRKLFSAQYSRGRSALGGFSVALGEQHQPHGISGAAAVRGGQTDFHGGPVLRHDAAGAAGVASRLHPAVFGKFRGQLECDPVHERGIFGAGGVRAILAGHDWRMGPRDGAQTAGGAELPEGRAGRDSGGCGAEPVGGYYLFSLLVGDGQGALRAEGRAESGAAAILARMEGRDADGCEPGEDGGGISGARAGQSGDGAERRQRSAPGFVGVSLRGRFAAAFAGRGRTGWLLAAVPRMLRWVGGAGANRWTLRESGRQYLIYLGAKSEREIDLTGETGKFAVSAVDLQTGTVRALPEKMMAGGKVNVPATGDGAAVVWLTREE